MGWGERFRPRREWDGEAPQKPIIPSPADSPNGPARAQVAALPAMIHTDLVLSDAEAGWVKVEWLLRQIEDEHTRRLVRVVMRKYLAAPLCRTDALMCAIVDTLALADGTFDIEDWDA